MKIKKINIFVASILISLTGVCTLAYAEGKTITMCVRQNGLVYIIGKDFKRDECRKNDQLISWNTEGVPGPKGDKGEVGTIGPKGEQGVKGDVGPAGAQGIQGAKGDKGDSATHGAGNIAFCSSLVSFAYCQLVLKTDGTIWQWNPNDNKWIINPNTPRSVPIPVSDIVLWDNEFFLDKNGDVWRYEQTTNGNGDQWRNDRHPN